MRHLCVSLTELCTQFSYLSLCLAGNFHDVTKGDLFVCPYAKSAFVTNLIVLIVFNIRYFFFLFQATSQRISFNV